MLRKISYGREESHGTEAEGGTVTEKQLHSWYWTGEGALSQGKSATGASLVAQWLRICLPMQGTRVRALVWEDPTCRRATRPVSHNY